jgi:hypothetical protein
MSGLSARAALILAGGAIIAAAVVPVSAQAAKIAAVKISDGKHTAKISASGALEVGDASGPLTVDGSVTASVAGPVSIAGPVSVAGPVQTRPAFPGTPFQQSATFNGAGGFPVLFTTTTNQTAYISSVTLSLDSTVATGAEPGVITQKLAVIHGPATMACDNPGPVDLTKDFVVTTTTGETTHLEFPTPMVVSPADAKTCLIMLPGLPAGDSAVYAMVMGYLG